jgi:hypothetical protein
MMVITVNNDFLSICKDILEQNRKEEEWAKLESDDMFQEGPFEGGYDADEMAFCFSYYANDEEEYWFQLTLKEIYKVANGEIMSFEGRPAE